MMTDLCIYTIKHSDDLREALAAGGCGTYSERKRWVRAKRLLEDAKRAGERLPVIFAPAEETFHLFAWAVLDEVVPGETSTYTFSELRLFDPQPYKTTLKKASDGEPLDEWFIRPYAICRTPDYLLAQAADGVRIPQVSHPIYWPRGVRLRVYDANLVLIDQSKDRQYDLNDNLFQVWGHRIVYLGVEVHSKNWPEWDKQALSWIEHRILWDLYFDGNEVDLTRHTPRLGRPCTEEFIWRLDVR